MITKQIATLAVSMLLTLSTIAQKNEIKAAEKALKKKNYAVALSEIGKADAVISNADAKSQAKYHYIKGMAYYAEGSEQGNIDKVIASFNALKKVEQESNSFKYSNEVNEVINSLIKKIESNATATYNAGKDTRDSEKLTEAANGYEKIFELSSKDTLYLYNSAIINGMAKNYEKSNAQYKKVLDLGYTGIETIYTAKSTVNDEVVRYNSSIDMMNEVKLKLAKEPKTTISESKYMTIIKGIGKNYIALEDNENALKFISQARKENPTDYNLIIEEGNIYYMMGDYSTYMEKIEEALKIKPNEPGLHYTIGTLILESGENLEKAVGYFKKAIELDSNYRNAYINMGAILYKKLEPIEDEMNANASSFAKYDKIKEEKYNPVLREILPLIEKAYEIEASDDVRNQLNSLYEALEMEKRID